MNLRLWGIASLVAVIVLLSVSAALGQEREHIIISDTLRPARLVVSPGTVVTWRNRDGERHRVRSRRGPVKFDSGNLEPGERFSVTFVVEGRYPYLDERNDDGPAYFGTIIVRGRKPIDGPPPAGGTVTLIDESFQPPALEVAVGAKVTWENIDGDDDHTVTSTEGVFNSGVLPAGSGFEHPFDAPGAYFYFCAIHPEMEGSITVIGDAPAQPAESPATDGEPAPDTAGAAGSGAVSIVDLSFTPSIMEIETGTTVTWTNADSIPHTSTASDGTFDSGVLAEGETFSQTFDTPGTYEYVCSIHPSMTGTVSVLDSAPTGIDGDSVVDDEPTLTEVAVIDVSFEPANIEVPVGTTVEWTNDDPFDHTVTAQDGAFDSGTLSAGGTFSHRFDSPGEYEYLCAIHPSMTGTVTVTP